MEKDTTEKYVLLRQMLIDARNKAELKQSDVSSKLGKPQSYISKIERGERGMNIVEFIEIAQAIGFDPTKFLREFIKFNY